MTATDRRPSFDLPQRLSRLSVLSHMSLDASVSDPLRRRQPDFSPWSTKTVKIDCTGTRPGDFRAADEAAGITSAFRKGANPESIKYTWHHVADCTTMQLVPTALHAKSGHSGGFSMYEKGLC